MTKFVQIGDIAFNPDHIESIIFDESSDDPYAVLYFAPLGQKVLEVKTENYDNFLHWWESFADVYRVS